MSFFAPEESTRKVVKFWLDCAQALTIVLAVIGAGFTYWSYQDTRTRELRKAYDEKQLVLYADAARVLAHLAMNPSPSQDMITRFWELYYGELAIVESRVGANSVAAIMVEFCANKFTPRDCGRAPTGKDGTSDTLQKLALTLAHQVSAEVRSRWGESK